MTELRFRISRTVGAPSDAVWRVLGDFGNEHRWTRSVARCTRDTPDVRVGTRRTCTLPRPLMGRREAREELTEYEPGSALGYVLDGSAGPFATAASRWSTRSTADGMTVVTVEGRFTTQRGLAAMAWPLMRPALRRLTRGVIGELETFVLRDIA